MKEAFVFSIAVIGERAGGEQVEDTPESKTHGRKAFKGGRRFPSQGEYFEIKTVFF